MNDKDEKFYFSVNHGLIIHKGQSVLQDETNPIYQKQLAYQINDGAFDDIDDQYIDISVKLLSLIKEETRLYKKRIEDGQSAIAKISAEFRIGVQSGNMPLNKQLDLEALLAPVRNEILAGQWINAKRKLEDIGMETVGKPPYMRLLTEINNYIAENYD